MLLCWVRWVCAVLAGLLQGLSAYQYAGTCLFMGSQQCPGNPSRCCCLQPELYTRFLQGLADKGFAVVAALTTETFPFPSKGQEINCRSSPCGCAFE